MFAFQDMSVEANLFLERVEFSTIRSSHDPWPPREENKGETSHACIVRCGII